MELRKWFIVGVVSIAALLGGCGTTGQKRKDYSELRNYEQHYRQNIYKCPNTVLPQYCNKK